jgi:hypothetical protein
LIWSRSGLNTLCQDRRRWKWARQYLVDAMKRIQFYKSDIFECWFRRGTLRNWFETRQKIEKWFQDFAAMKKWSATLNLDSGNPIVSPQSHRVHISSLDGEWWRKIGFYDIAYIWTNDNRVLSIRLHLCSLHSTPIGEISNLDSSDVSQYLEIWCPAGASLPSQPGTLIYQRSSRNVPAIEYLPWILSRKIWSLSVDRAALYLEFVPNVLDINQISRYGRYFRQ